MLEGFADYFLAGVATFLILDAIVLGIVILIAKIRREL